MCHTQLHRRIIFLIAAAFCAAIASGCSAPRVPGGRIIIRNDILDKEFNSFVVDQVIAGGAQAGFRRELRPGDEVTIPHKHVQSIRFTRRYKDFSRVYLVECPSDLGVEVKMNLIDVHSNRLGGGCVLTKRGEIRSGTTTWEK